MKRSRKKASPEGENPRPPRKPGGKARKKIETERIDDVEVVGSSTALARADTSTGLVHLDPLTLYIGEIRRYPVLDPEEEKRLTILYYEDKDEEAARRVIRSNLRLVVKIAFEYKRAYKNVLDLIQEGNIGLLLALKKFDPYRGVRFISYAAWWIRAYILRYILNNWRMVRIGTTQTQRKLFFNLHKEKERLEKMGIKPDPKAIAQSLQVSEKEVVEMDRRLAATDMSLDSTIRGDAGREITKLDTIGDPSIGAEEILTLAEFNDELHERLAKFGSGLEGKEAYIFNERLLSDKPMTLQEIGEHFGITRERVRQLETRVLKRLKEYLLEEMGEYFDAAQF
jgi:RNA polymerase sigma-32 factor